MLVNLPVCVSMFFDLLKFCNLIWKYNGSLVGMVSYIIYCDTNYMFVNLPALFLYYTLTKFD